MKNIRTFVEILKRWSNDTAAQSESLKDKITITVNSPGARNTKDIEIVVPLKYLINIWRILEMSLTNCEIYLILTSYEDCYFFCKGSNKVVTLSTQNNAKLRGQLK